MGRRSQTKHLDLWMNGQPRHAARDTLSYSKTWFDAPLGRPLSLSLPFQPGNLPHQGETVHNYFSNLLPDSQPILERLAQRFKTGNTEAFDLLAEIGRDCVGALQIVPATLPAQFPAHVADRIFAGLQDAAERMGRMN